MFGEECVDFSDVKNISVTVDGKTVHICLETRVRGTTTIYVEDVQDCCCFSCFLMTSPPLITLISLCATRMNAQRTTP